MIRAIAVVLVVGGCIMIAESEPSVLVTVVCVVVATVATLAGLCDWRPRCRR